MYEQYTDKQIVEMLKPKLEKLGWGPTVSHLERYPSTCKVIATIYRSAYIRGQLGRSFIIEQPKWTEHWILATKDNVKVGSKVRMIDGEAHSVDPECNPIIGTEGTVEEIGSNICLVKWPKGTTSYDDKWYCTYEELEVLLYE